MSEKTAEEKLRQALEGGLTGDRGGRDSSGNSPKPRARVKTPSPRTGKPDNISQRVDSFMDDFERMMEQSMSAVKPHEAVSRPPKSSKPAKQESPRRVRRKPETQPVDVLPDAQAVDVLPETQPVDALPETPTVDALPETPTVDVLSDTQPVDVLPDTPTVDVLPETPTVDALPEIQPVDVLPDIQPVEALPETPTVDVLPETQPVDVLPESELPEIPVIEEDFYQPQESSADTLDGLPDIPVITPDETDDFTEDFIDDTLSDDDGLPDEETTQEQPADFQEAELLEAPDDEDEFADIEDTDEEITDAFSDEPIDEEPVPSEPDEDAPPYDAGTDEAGIFADDFTPAADVVVSVDDDLPQIPEPDAPADNPEAEPAPVTVTMPESTKTAEDKLMADIAEAMTGNPLSLDSQEQPGGFAVPENFFSPASDQGDSQQSAEDKLKANIAQALSESPIDTARKQARQDFEQDISPFDDLPELDAQTSDEPPQEDTEDTQDDPLPDFEAVPDTDTEPDEPAGLDDADDDPFAVPDSADDETQPGEDAFPEAEIIPEPDVFPEIEPDTAIEPVPEPEPAPETEDVQDAFTDAEDDMPFAIDEPVSEPKPEDTLIPHELHLTEQDRLAQEVAAMTQEFEPEETPEFDTDTTHEEAAQEDNMPEQSLLDDDAQEGFSTNDNDDWDMSELGELGAATTLPDDEPEDFSAVPGTVTEMITEPIAGIIPNPGDEHKETEKTVNIREKLASRKDGASDSAPAGKNKSSGGGGIIMPILLGLLIIIGGLILWQLMTMSDKLTSLAMSSPSYESVSGAESVPSYAYAIDFILDPNLADRMAQRGREGWQVVGSRRTQDSTTGQYGYELIFMRRIPGR